MARLATTAEAVIIVLAVHLIARANTSVVSPELLARTTPIKLSFQECNSDTSRSLLYPQEVTHLTFHENTSVCQSRKCLERGIIDCEVEGWIDQAEPRVKCSNDSVPLPYYVSYAKVECSVEGGCLVCRLKYELAEDNGDDHTQGLARISDLFGDMPGEHVVRLVLFVAVLGVLMWNGICAWEWILTSLGRIGGESFISGVGHGTLHI